MIHGIALLPFGSTRSTASPASTAPRRRAGLRALGLPTIRDRAGEVAAAAQGNRLTDVDFDANPNIDPADPHPRHLRVDQEGPAALPDRRLRHRQVAPADRAGHRGRDGGLPGPLHARHETGQRAGRGRGRKKLTKTIARYGRVDLLCIDELGYMELDRQGAELLFQVLTEREEKNSVAIASNESSAAGPRPSPIPGSARPSSTGSRSPATSSRPAPTPTGWRMPAPNGPAVDRAVDLGQPVQDQLPREALSRHSR